MAKALQIVRDWWYAAAFVCGLLVSFGVATARTQYRLDTLESGQANREQADVTINDKLDRLTTEVAGLRGQLEQMDKRLK